MFPGEEQMSVITGGPMSCHNSVKLLSGRGRSVRQ